MAKGMRVKLNYEVSRDPDTGAEITRLTPPEVTCHRNYFYQKCFFNDGSHLLFAGEFDGNWNYYLLDLAKAEAVQLTEGAGDNTFGGFLSPDDKSLYYVKNDRTLLEVNLTTLQEREVYRVADDWVGYGTWVANSDCTKLVGIEIAKSDWTPLNDWQIFHDFFHKGPHCRLLRVDLQTGESSVIHEEKKWLGHPIYRPFDDHTVAFCHEGPHDLVDARMWMVNEDGSNVRKVKEHAEGESCTHEFWVPNGSALVYVSYLKGQQGRTIYSFNPDTGVNEAVMQMPACSHLMSNFDGTLLVGDGSGTPVDVKDTSGYTIDNDPYLYAFDVAKQAYFRVARHDTSWATVANSRQVTHPHPSFTPDDSAILFSSDKDGKPAVYISKLPPQPEMLKA
ncbi:oligogalacturonate lyase family protein [Klebsiella oxytoca]|uniref:oligogalacturonate lyase family protein n=1 Tax=Klebsiella oxytoca TaxID=571 RepID=UPI00190EAFAF|nr:oligogalacturonate lyase family protein [Klebsiella oxytoca]MBK0676327.1 oligogalacturonate lyase [Klebsiella oxytoca]MCE5398296.1 PD40 domain-containing protein [Klebsiella oxytoca]HEC2037424.1 PD40 domain-containing protein [Klebsiella oxytoca]HEC2100163.1 PD40 domain-containing protein [Klebsiella oxytoca]HEJ7340595.1 PD40 domain-containing protein [Klebsiella oxytoca]